MQSHISKPKTECVIARPVPDSYQITGNTAQKIVINGIELSIPIRIKNGQPFVPTAFPIGVKK